MVGRRAAHDEGQTLAIRTNFGGKGKGVAVGDGTEHSTAVRALPGRRTASMSSTGSLDDEQMHTHLSASSAGNTDISSTSGVSGNSTARTSNMTDDDRPSASNPANPSPYAHPTLTVLELVTNTASSSALPDSFDFNVSRKGNFIAVYSSSNIWLVKTIQLPRLWARTLQVKRKPVAIDITEDGFLLAVLSRPSQVDLYEIYGEMDRQIKKRRTVMLVHEASTLVISPDGFILIAGNKFGIEVVAIGPEAPETARRTLSGPVGDTLEFSDDGRTLLITGYARKTGSSSLYVLPGLYDGPFDDEGVPIPQAPATVWTTSVLFPETAKIACQATLLPDADTGQVNDIFAFNSQEDMWGVYDISNQRFTQHKMFLPDQQRWTRSEFIDDAMPAVSPNSDLAAVALRMRGTTSIWIYQVPEWDFRSTSKSDQSPIQPCFCIPILNDGSDSVQEICALRWVSLSAKVQRLVAVGNSSTMPADEVPGAPVGSKGVVIALDFDKSKSADSPVPAPTKTMYDLDPLCPGEMLPEGSIDFEREVELVRTRTLAQRRAQPESRRHSRTGSTPGRALTSANREPPVHIREPVADEEELTAEEAQAAFEVPYDMQQPRSQLSLARAATVAAVSPANRRHLRALPFRPLEYRRADGLREFPHESDADNWVPPPPAYTATAEASQSVSLSHPDGAPVPTNAPSASVARPSAIPPVPALPTNLSRPPPRPQHPYQSRNSSFQSQSSVDLTRPTPRTQATLPQEGRRPSLLHPSTFPSPQSVVSGRRRSSAASRTFPPQTQRIPPLPTSMNQSAYQATASLYSSANAAQRPTSRPPIRPRRAVESSFNLRPPPLVDPTTGRRGSAPETRIPRRPLPAGSNPNRASMPASPNPPRTRERRAMLPRLSTRGGDVSQNQGHGHVRRGVGPLSAPPRTDSGNVAIHHAQSHGRSPSRLEGWLGGKDRDGREGKEGSPRKKLGCVVM
ncbi:hypothetical protein CC80DRAFT_493374 [Byssothecium circinans]|uniref:DUF7165 domain-containing protein n=1 Tax=Byssothecium circinans TaxID=147558 RepID=A0A6A5TQT8_9PLEO|nr:hypothetical protein CC80DRAFT_493374 [Byssothecium circinans]